VENIAVKFAQVHTLTSLQDIIFHLYAMTIPSKSCLKKNS